MLPLNRNIIWVRERNGSFLTGLNQLCNIDSCNASKHILLQYNGLLLVSWQVDYWWWRGSFQVGCEHLITKFFFFWPCLICIFSGVQQRAYQYTSPVQEWLRNVPYPVLGINTGKKITFVKPFQEVLGFLLKLKYSVTAQSMNLKAPWLPDHFCKMEITIKSYWNPDWYIGSRFFSLMKKTSVKDSHGCCRSPVRNYLHTHQSSSLKALTALEMDTSLRIVQHGPDLSLNYTLPSYLSAVRSGWLIQLLAESPIWSERDLVALCLGGVLDVWRSCFTRWTF